VATIYRFKPIMMIESRRWGTREAVDNIAHGQVLEHTAVDVDESAIESDIPGLTRRSFDPHSAFGFQTSELESALQKTKPFEEEGEGAQECSISDQAPGPSSE
jgi:hypothetical protein